MLNGKEENSARVSRVTTEGVWLIVGTSEYVLSSVEFPWFRGQPEEAVRNLVQDPWGDLHWPDLDVDLELDALRHPENYPLIMR